MVVIGQFFWFSSQKPLQKDWPDGHSSLVKSGVYFRFLKQKAIDSDPQNFKFALLILRESFLMVGKVFSEVSSYSDGQLPRFSTISISMIGSLVM